MTAPAGTVTVTSVASAAGMTNASCHDSPGMLGGRRANPGAGEGRWVRSGGGRWGGGGFAAGEVAASGLVAEGHACAPGQWVRHGKFGKGGTEGKGSRAPVRIV